MVIAQAIKKHVESWGYEATYITDFKDVLSQFVSYSPQIVLLDISLPFFNGYHWCQEIRKVSKVPIIFISSVSDNMNIVMAMNMGGDDFVAKPFDLQVLTAKIQALIRRTYNFSSETNLLEHNGVILNLNDATVSYEGKAQELTKNELKIFQTLLTNKTKVMSRDEIMASLWKTDSYIDDNTLTVNMTRLRKKLEEIGIVNFITTKKGMGYIVE